MPRSVAICILLVPLLGGSGAVQGQSRPEHRLPEVRRSARTPCQVHPETAAETADLWVAAREALEGSRSTAGEPPLLLMREWRKTLGPRFEYRWERSDTSRAATRHPFEKPPPANLERAGYIQRHGWTTVFYGPDAGLLLSEGFLRRHCFRRVAGSGEATGLLGLAFAPLPDAEPTDVAGTLWIDPAARELRYVEYHWTNPPEEGRAPGVGGRSDFVRLPGAGWIVRRWNIRMPRLSAGPLGGFEGYTDQGGEVLAVTSRAPE